MPNLVRTLPNTAEMGVSQLVVVNCKQTILLIPDELALSDTFVPMSVGHNMAGVHIYRFSVVVVCIDVTVLDIVVAVNFPRTV